MDIQTRHNQVIMKDLMNLHYDYCVGIINYVPFNPAIFRNQFLRFFAVQSEFYRFWVTTQSKKFPTPRLIGLNFENKTEIFIEVFSKKVLKWRIYKIQRLSELSD